jgi:hypothetical protein
VLLTVLLAAVLIIGILLVIMLLTQKPKDDKAKKSSRIQFFAKGKKAGFHFGELELLYQLAIKSNLQDASLLFSSQTHLDTCISTLLKSARLSGEDKQRKSQDFLARLYDYRKQIEFEKPEYRKGIKTTRNIDDDQPLKILIRGIGVFPSRVIKNTSHYMTILKPTENVPPGINWSGRKISIYFWRRDDAGYVFDSFVSDEVFSRGYASLQISNSDALFRTQKRNAVRVKMDKPAFLYLSKNGVLSKGPEKLPGLKCMLSDLSESGYAVIIGGKAKKGIRIKVQFALKDAPITMNGTVKSVDYIENENKSILHVEADPLPLAVKNRIQGEVFGVQENDNDLDLFSGFDDENEYLYKQNQR